MQSLTHGQTTFLSRKVLWIEIVSLIVVLLAVLALLTAGLGVLASLLIFIIPCGAAQYVHFTFAEIVLRYAVLGCFAVMALVNLFIAVGFIVRSNKARIVAMILSPAPFVGALISSASNGIELLLQYTGISFPAMTFFILPFLTQFYSLSLNIPLWSSIVHTVRLFLGICNIVLLFFLRSNPRQEPFPQKGVRKAP
jgi:flagellar basal body-associated protein FliL